MKSIIKFFTVLTIFMLSLNTNAQVSEITISPYLGVGGTFGGDKIQTPAFGFNAEYFLDETLAVGVHIGYSTVVNDASFGNPEEETGGIVAGALINYYWTDSDTFNFYTGGSVGYDGHSGPFVDSGFYYEVHAGGRYQLSEKLGVFSEIGFGLSLLKLGVSFGF